MYLVASESSAVESDAAKDDHVDSERNRQDLYLLLLHRFFVNQEKIYDYLVKYVNIYEFWQ